MIPIDGEPLTTAVSGCDNEDERHNQSTRVRVDGRLCLVRWLGKNPRPYLYLRERVKDRKGKPKDEMLASAESMKKLLAEVPKNCLSRFESYYKTGELTRRE